MVYAGMVLAGIDCAQGDCVLCSVLEKVGEEIRDVECAHRYYEHR